MWKAVLSGALFGVGTIGAVKPDAQAHPARTAQHATDDFTAVQDVQVQGFRNERGYCQLTLHLTNDDPAPGGMATLADTANCLFDVTYGVYSRTPLDDSSQATLRTFGSSQGAIYGSTAGPNRQAHSLLYMSGNYGTIMGGWYSHTLSSNIGGVQNQLDWMVDANGNFAGTQTPALYNPFNLTVNTYNRSLSFFGIDSVTSFVDVELSTPTNCSWVPTGGFIVLYWHPFNVTGLPDGTSTADYSMDAEGTCPGIVGHWNKNDY